jgi:uncharacterized membrane protein YbjE (DUF340 family)
MTIKIIIVLIAGIMSGLFIFPKSLYDTTGLLLDIGLCCLLFFVGLDIGRNKDTFKNIKLLGFRIIMIPISIISGTLFGGVVCSLIFRIDIFGSLAVASGLAWYTLAPIIITPYSSELGAIAFLSNVFREVISFITIPFIAKRIGYLETIAVSAAISMDTGLPIITKNTNQEVIIVSFISGIIVSIVVPILVPFFIELM